MQDRVFGKADVIEASRKFVCVRIDSYGSEENQKIVRSYLNGKFANTAFCLLAPDGEERLTRSGRGPRQALGGDEDFAQVLLDIAAKYEPRGDVREAAMPDFPSFKLALNVSAADQRLLVLLAGPEDRLAKAEKRLQSLAWDAKVQGRLHYDLETSDAWKKPLSLGKEASPGIYVIQPDPYGLEGKVMKHLALDSPIKAIKTAMTNANASFNKTTSKRVYTEHVAEGRRQGITINMAMPFGEDKDGDGEIDPRRGNRRRSR